MTITLLDGGFGTTLEQVFHLNVSHQPLWSTKAILDSPAVIIQAHLAFLRAGTRMLSTATYQCSYMEFERAGINDRNAAKEIMRRSVELACEARKIFINEGENQVAEQDVGIAFVMGPFGASLDPPQEWDAVYPPPYGPTKYVPGAAQHRNAFTDDELELEESSVEALAEFHRGRLEMLLEDDAGREVWKKVDCFAFETIPLVREVTAIRRAVRDAFEDRKELEKPWWISSIFPDGKVPEMRLTGTGNGEARLTVRDLVLAELTGDLPRPRGIGINCTSLEFIPGLLREFEREVCRLREDDSLKSRLWLVLYPNAGDTYDVVAEKWVDDVDDHVKEQRRSSWAAGLRDAVQSIRDSGVWERILVGGCCRTNPDHLRKLGDALVAEDS
ncbi:AdoMet-homocysteine methyltransferase [Paramarasmius palmivorus]|uniref:AdoMet-homocysteine methyltransferase n=1 Tax=Paramarasmius palmivorus TaxID=297713 RepID=A0AAW0CVL2_9AGAR